MRHVFYIIALLFPIIVIPQTGDDGWNNRNINEYENDIEKARVSLTFLPGFDTEGHTFFVAIIDPDIPFNGGIPVTDGEFNMNYIRQYSPIHDNVATTLPDHNTLNYDLWAENITYYDGLGRPIQKIAVRSTAAGTDLIQPIIYDEFGRVKKDYLTYAITQGGSNGPGGFRPDFLPEQQNFYGFYNPGEHEYALSEKGLFNIFIVVVIC